MAFGFRFSMAVLVLVAVVAGPVALAGEPVNLLSNGGFEEGTTGWNPDPKHSLVTEPGEAHSGKACLSGEVAGPSQALLLRRRVPVKAGNRYQFEVWARATGRTKLVLRAVEPGTDPQTPLGAARRLVAAFEDVPEKWRLYTTPLTVPEDGMLELVLVAPSSHGAPPGRLWIDDLALYETEMPVVQSVSQGAGFNDEPAMALSDDGSVYVAWNSFRDGADSLQIARYQSENKSLKPAGQWQVLGGEGAYVLGIEAVSAGEKAVVLYAAETDKNWDVYAVTCGPDGPSTPQAVGGDPGVDLKPSGAWHQGTLWVAWESNRTGSRQIFAASVAGGNAEKPVALSADGTSNYGPSIVALQNGDVCVAWHSFRENNYDVYLRRRAADGSWGLEMRLTRAPSVDRHPVLVTRGDDLWLVYENAQTGGRDKPYRLGATDHRRLIVAKVTPEGLLAPKDYAQTSPLYGRCEAPRAAFDASGRLWLAYLKPRLPARDWDVYVTCLTGGGWQRPSPVFTQKSMDRRPALAVGGDRGLVAFQADPNAGSWARRRPPRPRKTWRWRFAPAVRATSTGSKSAATTSSSTPRSPGDVKRQ